MPDVDRRLTDTARARRDAMRGVLRDRFVRRHRRRRALRGAAVIVAIASVVGVVRWQLAPVSGPPVALDVAPPPPASTVADVVLIRSDPAIAARYVFRKRAVVPTVDDDGLLAMLDGVEGVDGLVRRGDRAWLLTRSEPPPP